MAPPAPVFTYSLLGAQCVVLSEGSTADYAERDDVREAVHAAARTRAANTGRPVTVLMHDRATVLFEVAPPRP